MKKKREREEKLVDEARQGVGGRGRRSHLKIHRTRSFGEFGENSRHSHRSAEALSNETAVG